MVGAAKEVDVPHVDDDAIDADLAVVDPGVGSGRRSIAVRDREGRVFIGPDNGLLIPAADRAVVRVITPGTLTEDSLLDARSHNYLAAIAEAQGELALAWLESIGPVGVATNDNGDWLSFSGTFPVGPDTSSLGGLRNFTTNPSAGPAPSPGGAWTQCSANATMANALDYDEGFHISTHVIPTALAVAEALAAHEAKINAELIAAQGKPVDTGGYYLPDQAKTSAGMRPSATLNAALANL